MSLNSPAMIALVPINNRAHEALRLLRNRYLISTQNDQQVFDIGLVPSTDSGTLATLGRRGDIVLEGSDIAKTHCSIEFNLEANVVMFCNKLRHYSSIVYGRDAPMECGRPAKIVLCQGINYIIGIGDLSNDPYQFELIWYQNPPQTTIGTAEGQGFIMLEENPHLTKTIDESETAPQSQTQFHTAGAQQLPDFLEYGTYGDICKEVDLDLGRTIAAQQEMSVNEPNMEWHREVAPGFTKTLSSDDPVFAGTDPVFANANSVFAGTNSVSIGTHPVSTGTGPVFVNADPVYANPFFPNPLFGTVPADTILADPISIDFQALPMHQAACQAVSHRETSRPAVSYQTTATPQPAVPPNWGPRRNTIRQTLRRLAPKPDGENFGISPQAVLGNARRASKVQKRTRS
ncbi:hypothetical protein F4679DRAFT_592611 [Xylaria curta]|nr:hypothetical protein F4679DRAFT_592611 [Xylaria curta]